jgi:hypothetical protein
MTEQKDQTEAAGVASALTQMLDAEPAKAPTTTDIYILVVRYGDDFWSARSTHRNIDDARKTGAGCNHEAGQTAWRIVRVTGLPVSVADGEV